MRHSKIRLSLILALLCVCPPAPLCADELDDAYQRVLANPQDQDALAQYSATAVNLKDYEAAIPPLECLLMSNPDDADLQIAIGSLYLSLGSKDIAKEYFEDAENSPKASDDSVDKAKGYLRGL